MALTAKTNNTLMNIWIPMLRLRNRRLLLRLMDICMLRRLTMYVETIHTATDIRKSKSISSRLHPKTYWPVIWISVISLNGFKKNSTSIRPSIRDVPKTKAYSVSIMAVIDRFDAP